MVKTDTPRSREYRSVVRLYTASFELVSLGVCLGGYDNWGRDWGMSSDGHRVLVVPQMWLAVAMVKLVSAVAHEPSTATLNVPSINYRPVSTHSSERFKSMPSGRNGSTHTGRVGKRRLEDKATTRIRSVTTASHRRQEIGMHTDSR